MISAEAKAAGKDGGYRGWQLYLAGRAGVLGDVGTEVCTRRSASCTPTWCAPAGRAGRRSRRCPRRCALRRGVPLLGPDRYAGLAEADRLADLLERVARAADAGGLGRCSPPGGPSRCPTTRPAGWSQLLHVLREHRGGAHLGRVRSRRAAPAGGDRRRRRRTRQRDVLRLAPSRCPRPPTSCGPGWPGAEEATDAQVAPGVRRAGRRRAADDLLRLLGEAAAAAARARSEARPGRPALTRATGRPVVSPWTG